MEDACEVTTCAVRAPEMGGVRTEPSAGNQRRLFGTDSEKKVQVGLGVEMEQRVRRGRNHSGPWAPPSPIMTEGTMNYYS